MRDTPASWRFLRSLLLLTVLSGMGLPVPGSTAEPPTSVPDPAKPLSLDQATAIALTTEPNIQARLRNYEAAQFRVTQALSPVLPQVTGTWDASRQQIQFFRSSIGGAGAEAVPILSTTTTARVTLSQILFDFGKTFAAVDVARSEAEVARLDAETQKDGVVLAVKEAYFNLLFAKRLVTVNQAALERSNLNLKSARGFFEVGTRPKSDVTRAEVDVASDQVNLIRTRNAVSLARVALNTAMGIAIDTPTEVQDLLFYEPYTVDQSQLVSEALRERAEYRRVTAVVASGEASVRQAFRDFFPDISGFGSYGGRARDPDSVTDLREEWQVGVLLNWSIFDGSSRIARYREAKKIVEAARAQVEALELAISQEVAQAYLNLQAARERIAAEKKRVESARENFRLAQGRFDAGVGTILELTDAQLALTRAEATEAQALTDHRIAIARLERALGRR